MCENNSKVNHTCRGSQISNVGFLTRRRTSWYNARLALDQIDKGKARGNRTAVWLRDIFQYHFYTLGCFIQRNAGKVLFVGLLVLFTICVGLKSIVMETNVERLWVEVDGRLEKELNYIRKTLGDGFGNTNQLVIQTPKFSSQNILKPNALLHHLEAVNAGIQVTVEMFDVTWRLKDVCYSWSIPPFEEHHIYEAVEKLMPCAIITPLDCFWEGAKLLGPEDNIKIPGLSLNAKWSTINPQLLMDLMSVNQVNPSSGRFPFEIFRELMKRAGITTAYQNKPCLDPNDENCPASAPNKKTKRPVDIGAELTGGCYGFATKFMHWPEELIVGGVEKNKSGHIRKANAYQTIVQLMAEQDMFEYWKRNWKVHNIDWSVEKARMVLEEWQRKFAEEVRMFAANFSEKDYNIHQFTSVSMSDIMKNFSHLSPPKVFIAYALMLIYTALVLTNWKDTVNSQCFLGVTGALLISLSLSAGLGFCAIIRLPFNASTTQIIPFLAIGLGMDALFLFAHTYMENSTPESDYEEIIGNCLKQIGCSILMTSACNVAGFGAAAVIPIPALRAFACQSAILLIFTTASSLLLLPAVAGIDLRRRRSGRMDLLCCFHRKDQRNLCKDGKRINRLHSVVQTKKHYVIRDCGTGKSVSFKAVPSNVEKCDPKSLESLMANTPESQLCKDGTDCDYYNSKNLWSDMSITFFVKEFYAPILLRKPVKIIVILTCLAVFLVCSLGLPLVDDGLELTDIVPRSTPEYQFLSAQRHYFSVFNTYAVTQGNFDYPNNQKLLLEFHKAFTRVAKVLKNDDGGLQDFWLTMFRDWLKNLQNSFDLDWDNGCIIQERWFPNASADGILAYKLMVQTGRVDNPIDKSLVTKARLVDEEGIINPKAFYNYLTVWVSNDALAYSASQANFHPEPRNWVHTANDYELKIPKSQPLVYAQIPFYLYNMGSTTEITSTIEEIRAICKKFEEKGLPNFPTGIPFIYWEQYVHLRLYLLTAIVIVLAAIFLVICFFLFNPWAAALVVVVLLFTVVELFGLIGLLSIRLSAVPAVILVVSFGVGANFLIHLTLGFLTSIGSKTRRMVMAMEHMFPPLTHGVISTFFGVAMLAFSEFDFIIRYFFHVLMGLILLGLLNGMALFPVLLSMIGPRAEVVPFQHKDRISTPSPPSSPPMPRRMRGSAPYFSRRSYPRVTSEISLSTISEEPQSYQSSHEIIVQPQLVLETTTVTNAPEKHTYSQTTSNIETEKRSGASPTPSTDRDTPESVLSRESHGSSSDSGNSSSSRCSTATGCSHPLGHINFHSQQTVTTKVTATAKVKVEVVEVHTPFVDRDYSSTNKNRYREHYRKSNR